MNKIFTFLLIFLSSLSAQWIQTSASGHVNGFAVLNNEIYSATDYGILVSTDNGETWNQSAQASYPEKAIISNGSDVFVSADNGIKIKSGQWSYVKIKDSTTVMSMTAEENNLFAGTYDRGVWFSSDGGWTWNKRSTGIPNGILIQCMAVSGNYVYAGTYGKGLYISSDMGLSWQLSNNGIPPGSDYSNGYWITGIVILQDRILISTFGVGGVFSSFDNGKNWQRSNAGIFDQYVYSLNRTGDYILCGTQNTILISTDKGVSWTDFTGQNNISGAQVMMTDRFLLAGDNTNGIWRRYITYYDFNSAWQHLNGPDTRDFISSVLLTGEYIFAASRDKGVFRSSDHGLTWTQVRNGMADTIMFCLAQNNNRIYAGAYSDKLYYSDNYGEKWDFVTIPIDDMFGKSIFGVSFINSDIYVGTGKGCFKTTDNGITWQKLQMVSGDEWNFYVYKILKHNGNLFAITYYGVLISTDGGNTWQNTSRFWMFSPPQNAFVLDNRLIVSTVGEGIFYTSDDGNNWIEMDNGLTDKHVFDLLYTNNIIFAGTEDGVFASADSGKSWDHVGLNRAYCFSLAADETYIYTGTYEHGVWKRKMLDLPVSVKESEQVKLPDSFELYQNYPNPFNPSTTIKYTIPESGEVSLKVYDILGTEIMRLTDGMKNAGTYEVRLDGSRLASGVYFYKLSFGSKMQMRKFILIK